MRSPSSVFVFSKQAATFVGAAIICCVKTSSIMSFVSCLISDRQCYDHHRYSGVIRYPVSRMTILGYIIALTLL
jgi:hypothetical protein